MFAPLSRGIANSQGERGVNMDATSKVDPRQLSESMASGTEFYLESVMQAVNSGPDGEWIAASEEQVRNFSVEFR